MADLTCEELATKAELQELRDQLNAVIAEQEGGGEAEVFKKGVDKAGTVAAVAATVWALTKDRALNAITDISVDGGATGIVPNNMANGGVKLKVLQGGQSKTVETMGKVIEFTGKNSKSGETIAKAVSTKGAMIGVLASLAAIGVTIALNKFTVDILGNRIDAEAEGTRKQLDALNSGILRLYDKQQGDIDAAVAEIDANNEIIQSNKQSIQTTKTEIETLKSVTDAFNEQIDTANTAIEQLQTQNQQLISEINSNNLATEEAISELNSQIEGTNADIVKANELIANNREIVNSQAEIIEQLELRNIAHEQRIQVLELEYVHLREELFKLKDELTGELDIVNDRVDDLQSKIAKTQKFVQQNQASGSSATATRGAADAQTSTLELASKLTELNPETPTITATDIQNNTTTFQDTLQDLLRNIQPGGSVDQGQIDDLVTRINNDFGTALDTKLSTAVIPAITQVQDQTTKLRLVQAGEEAICNSLNSPSPCGGGAASGATQGLKGLQDYLKNNIDQLNAGLNATIIGQNQVVKGIVQSTNDIVDSAEFGVKKAFELADKAWKATHGDKILNGITTALVIHNAVQLSANVGVTLGETANQVLNAIGIEDSGGKPFDVNAIIKAKMTSLISAVIGEQNYEALTQKLAQYNRVYQASANLLNSAYDLFDSARSTAELVAENTGKIGNALIESGVVNEDSYSRMLEDVNPQSKIQQKLEGLRGGLDSIEDTASIVDSIASSVVGTKDALTELRDTKQEWKEANEALIQTDQEERDVAEEDVAVTADIDSNDFDVAGEETGTGD